MAVLNSLFLLLAAWCVRRRLGDRSAIFALVFLGLLTWSFGADAFHSPVPVVAAAAPFAAFCFAAWALAAGDEGVLPVVVGLAAYLGLCHPSTAVLVPVIGLSALVLWFVAMRRRQRTDPASWDGYRRRSIRAAVVAIGIAVVLWIPPLIQELTTNPGNLTHLYRASGQIPTWMGPQRSAASVFTLFSGWPFWFRGSTDHSFLTGTAPIPSSAATVLTAVLFVVVALAAGWLAYRRVDRPAFSAVVLAVCAAFASWLHFLRSPSGQYFLPIWGVAAFVTFAFAYAFVRALPDRLKHVAPVVAVVFTAVLALLNLPQRPIPHFTASTAQERRISRALDRRILPAVRDRGTVHMAPAFYGTYPYAAALVVALDDAGVPVCADHIVSFQGYRNAACEGHRPGLTVIYRSAATFTHPPEGETVVARYGTLTPAEQQDWKELSLAVSGAIDALDRSGQPMRLTPAYRAAMRTGRVPDLRGAHAPEFLADPGLVNTSFSAQGSLARYVRMAADRSNGRVALTKLPGVSDADLLRWARLRTKLARGVVVTVKSRP